MSKDIHLIIKGKVNIMNNLHIVVAELESKIKTIKKLNELLVTALATKDITQEEYDDILYRVRIN